VVDGHATVTFTTSVSEVRRGAQAAWAKPPANRRVAAISGLMLIAALIAGFLTDPTLGIILSAGVVLLAMASVGAWLWARLAYDRKLGRHREHFARPMTVTVDEAGIHSVRGSATTTNAWDGLTEYLDREGFLVVRDGPDVVAVIPKRAFDGVEACDAFVAVLHAHLPEHAA
jgi:hypothetical protein